MMSNEQQAVLALQEESKELALSLHREQKKSARLQSAVDAIARKIVSKFPNENAQSLTLEEIISYVDRMVVVEEVESDNESEKGTKS